MGISIKLLRSSSYGVALAIDLRSISCPLLCYYNNTVYRVCLLAI
nr:MAG TPA_asm: hypothetical protein [Caudoviricetes sp.]